MKTGNCKHGEFNLTDGCPQCIEGQRRRQAGITPALDELEDGLNEEGLTLGNLAGAETIHEPDIQTLTAIVQIKPEQDEYIIALHNQALSLQEYAQARVIATPDDLKPATDDLSVIAKLKKALEEKRKEYVGPLRDYVDKINETFKILMEPILAADNIIRGKMQAFDAEQKRIRQEQEEINRLRIEAAQKEMELKGEITESIDLVEVIPEAPKRVTTEMGTVGQRDIWKYEVVDFALLPDGYKLADTALLNAIAKKHHDQKQVPGVRFYNEPIVTVNAR